MYIFISKYYTPYHLNWLSCQQYIQISESSFRCWCGWEQGNLQNTQKELCGEIWLKKKPMLFQETFQRCSISILWFNCGKRQASRSH